MNTEVVRTRAELHRARAALSGTVGVVMTMGALHEGHASLIRAARAECDAVLVTIFVNPMQFGAGEDLDRYPRTFEADLQLCQAEGAAVLFHPTAAEIYPPHGDPASLGVHVSAGALGSLLEGASRPGHFDGVLTVVAKLLQLTQPHRAYFGEKDAQQLLLIRRMVDGLNLPVQVVGVPTLREPDGLALSSRNVYLDAGQRHTALVLSRALRAGADAAAGGADAVRRAAHEQLAAEPDCALDYLVLCDPTTLCEVAADHHGAALLAVAARVGATRLIDNVTLVLPARATV